MKEARHRENPSLMAHAGKGQSQFSPYVARLNVKTDTDVLRFEAESGWVFGVPPPQVAHHFI